MCGRLKTPEELQEIRIELKVTDFLCDKYKCRYNVPPTLPVPVITAVPGGRRLEHMRWGLIPSWSKDNKSSYATFNARSDTVATKPAFRAAWKAGRRCLVMAEGFYEWRKKDKQPFFITLGNRQPTALAGLWEEWQSPDGELIRSCTVLTTEANKLMAEVHDRMPVILGPEHWAAWLGEEECDPQSLCVPFPAERMTLWPVDKRVGNVKNNDAKLTEKIKAAG